MKAGWMLALLAVTASAQTLDNRSLNGKYFFRQVQLTPDATGAATAARSALGAISFDGSGSFAFTGQQTVTASSAVTLSGSGVYTVSAAGLVTMTNPQRTTATLNARLGDGVVIASSTEGADNAYDLFAAIAAPTGPVGNAALSGAYWVGTLEFPLGSVAAVRNAFFSLTADGAGRFGAFTLSGHATDQGNLPVAQGVAGATYLIAADGSGTANFPGASLLGANKNLYVSRDGAYILGGSAGAGAHDLLIGIRASVTTQTAASWKDRFWTAGLRVGSRIEASAGSVSANGAGKLLWARRIRGFGAGVIDYTGVAPYSVSPDGSGTSLFARTAIGAGGAAFLGAGVSSIDPNAYELFFGVRMPPVSGTGVFLNPQGIVNAAGFAPAGNPVAPGEFVTLFGSGLSPSTAVASAVPFPVSGLAGVTVLVNGQPAPVYLVSAGQISALIPFATTGTKASIEVNNNGVKSNTVELALSKTAPGVFALDSTGTGAGAVLHADFKPVNAASKARRGETVLVFLTGLGATSPAVADGAPGPANPLSRTTGAVSVYIGGVKLAAGDIGYAGLAPGLPGLYQLNIRIPSTAPEGDAVPLAIETAEAFHDQVDLAIAP